MMLEHANNGLEIAVDATALSDEAARPGQHAGPTVDDLRHGKELLGTLCQIDCDMRRFGPAREAPLTLGAGRGAEIISQRIFGSAKHVRM
jgi:hypothetical protein